jgi:Tol biopolymer transport system component
MTMPDLVPFTIRRTWGSATVMIVVSVATAASGMVLAAVPGGATAGCPATGAGGSAFNAVGVPERAGGSWGGRLSADGRYVAFVSYQDDLVAGDANQKADVFRADRATGEIVRVSLDTDGSDFLGHAAEASISADGTRVAFSSGYQVYVRDLVAAHTVLASANNAGAAADDWSGAPVISPDGRFVAFTSRATKLVASDREDGSIEAYLRNLDAGTTERVSIGPGGLSAPTWSWAEAVSDGGRYVAFTAGWAGGTLTADDTYPGADVFVRDRQAQRTEAVSVAPDARSMGGWFLGMSADGMRILFGPGPQSDSKPAVFMRDRAAGTTRLVAPLAITWRRRADSAPAPLAFVRQRAGPPAALSADGQIAAIQTALPSGPDDTNAADDIVLVDIATGAWQPGTRSSSGCPGSGPSGEPTLSRDGTILGFTSEADDIAGVDNHRVTNVYVRETTARRTERISTAPAERGRRQIGSARADRLGRRREPLIER